jgi:hypothetical protein
MSCTLYFGDPPDKTPVPDDDPVFDDPDCWGFKCSPPWPDEPSPFESPEGGEIRIERLQIGAEEVHTSAQAFFFLGQVPSSRDLAGPPLNFNDPHSPSDPLCFDFRKGIYFANGAAPASQEIADTRTYLDMGSTVTLTSEQTGIEIVLDPMPPGTRDPSQKIAHMFLYLSEPEALVEPNAFYLPAIVGHPSYPTLDLHHGTFAFYDDMSQTSPSIHVPPDFTLTEPAEADFFGSTMTFVMGQRLAFTWENHEATPYDAPGTISFVRFSNEDDALEVMCLAPMATGELVVPLEVFQQIPPTGKIMVGKLVHTLWVRLLDDARMDLIGLNGKAGTYTVVEP